jgi:hypothetical protein
MRVVWAYVVRANTIVTASGTVELVTRKKSPMVPRKPKISHEEAINRWLAQHGAVVDAAMWPQDRAHFGS